MKLSLFQVETARSNPRRFGEGLAKAALEKKKGGFDSRQFRTYLSEAMGAYHAGKRWPDILKTFSSKCREKLERINYYNERTDRYEVTLASYFKSFPKQNVAFIEMGKRFTLNVGAHQIMGKIDRFDLRSPQGYRATDIQTNRVKTWRRKLRWPLIQQALALDMGASPAEVEVGIHCFGTDSYDYHIFEHVQLEAALKEAEEICDEIAEGADNFELGD